MDRRVAFDFEIEFTNGGGLQGQDFRLDVPGEDVTDGWIGDALVRDLRLLMVGDVRIQTGGSSRSRTSGESTGGVGRRGDGRATTRRPQPSDRRGHDDVPRAPGARDQAAPHPRGEHCPLRTRRDVRDRRHHAVRQHRDVRRQPVPPPCRRAGPRRTAARAARRRPGGARRRDRLGVARNRRAALLPYDLGGRAVLIHTGFDRHWGTEAYGRDNPFLTAAAVDLLVEAGAAIVGIDSLNIDYPADLTRPAHSGLLRAGIPILST